MTNKLLLKGSLLVLTPVVFEIVFIIILAVQLSHAQSELMREAKSRSIVNESDKLALNFGRLIVATSLPRSVSENQYKQPAEKTAQSLSKLEQLLKNSIRSSQLSVLHEHVTAGLSEVGKLGATSDLSDASFDLHREQINRTLRELSKSIDADLNALTAADRIIEETELAQHDRNVQSILALLTLAIIGSLILALGLSFYFSNSIVKRLRIVADNSVRLARGADLHDRLRDDDEIAQLDETFHLMAANLQQSMQRERALVENAVDVICAIDDAGSFTQVNAASLPSWGFEPGELIGKKYISLIAPDNRQKFLEQMQKAVESRSVMKTECSVVHKNGDSSQFSWTAVWSHTNQRLFCVVHDIEERTRLEQMKQHFTAMISHDLRTPLNSLKLVLEMLLTGTYGELNESGRPRVEKAEASVASLINLTTGLLDFEQQHAGKLKIFCRKTYLPDVLDAAIESVRPLASQAKVELQVNCANAYVNLDRERITQVLVNLLGNAVKFSPANSAVKVHVEPNATHVDFKVCDNGAGIPEEYREKIFDRFEQVHIDDNRLKGGTGLGLAICKMIVSEHRGDIGVSPNIPTGSIFWFKLPLAEDITNQRADAEIDKQSSN